MSGRSSAIVCVDFVTRLRATGLGWYPSCSTAASIDARVAGAIAWSEPWRRVLDDSRAPFYRWFAGGRLNTCWNALDRHVEGGRAGQPALVWDSPVTGSRRTFIYRELRDATARFAGALRAR